MHYLNKRSKLKPDRENAYSFSAEIKDVNVKIKCFFTMSPVKSAWKRSFTAKVFLCSIKYSLLNKE